MRKGLNPQRAFTGLNLFLIHPASETWESNTMFPFCIGTVCQVHSVHYSQGHLPSVIYLGSSSIIFSGIKVNCILGSYSSYGHLVMCNYKLSLWESACRSWSLYRSAGLICVSQTKSIRGESTADTSEPGNVGY